MIICRAPDAGIHGAGDTPQVAYDRFQRACRYYERPYTSWEKCVFQRVDPVHLVVQMRDVQEIVVKKELVEVNYSEAQESTKAP